MDWHYALCVDTFHSPFRASSLNHQIQFRTYTMVSRLSL